MILNCNFVFMVCCLFDNVSEEPGNRHRNPGYAAMDKSLDDGVGRVLELLKQSEILLG